MAPSPRLLLVITLAETGGAQTYVAQLIRGLRDRYDITVAAGGAGPLRAAAVATGVEYIELRRMTRELSLRDVSSLLELVRVIHRKRPDIVHANSSKAGILARLAAMLAGVPVRVFTVHGWAFKWHSGVRSTVYRIADRIVRPLSTMVICVAESDRQLGLAARTCEPGRSVVIPNAVDVRSAPISPLAGDPPLLVSVGRLKEPKDPVTLARALALLPPASLRAQIVGDGPDREAVAAILPDNAELVGERDDVPDLLAGADLFVLSSRSEGLPMSVIEAMAAGLPVIASRVGGMEELVLDAETGLLVPPGDVTALARAIRRLIDDPSLRRRMGAAARLRAEERFDLPAFWQAHTELYEKLLPNRSRR